MAKLKEQLQKMAMRRTGGEKTDELLGKNGSGPEGLPHSIIVTPEGIEGEVPVLISEAVGSAESSPNGAPEEEEQVGRPSPPERTRRRARGKRETGRRTRSATPKPARRPRRTRPAEKPTRRAARRKV